MDDCYGICPFQAFEGRSSYLGDGFGRLDSTNVVQPQASVITSIGLDHTEILGETLGEIAKEKAGIIKRGRPVILGRMPEDASRVIKKIAYQRGSTVHSVEKDFSRRSLPKTNLFGTIQEWNAATAVTTCEALCEQFPVSSEVIEASLQDVSWAGRWSELRAEDRTIIFDAAHNADALESLCENLSSLEHPPMWLQALRVRQIGQKRFCPFWMPRQQRL